MSGHVRQGWGMLRHRQPAVIHTRPNAIKSGLTPVERPLDAMLTGDDASESQLLR